MNINYKRLKAICSAPTSQFKRYGSAILDKPDLLIHRDNGASVLAVAHLDHVQDYKHFEVKNDLIHTETLDDRLGVYIVLCMLPQMGIVTDILLTTNEERLASTAINFEPPRRYNWIVEFDRRGNDVVCYQYETRKLRRKLQDCDFNVGFGSYSDICELGHLKCLGFNVGIGYHSYHLPDAFCHVPTMLKQVAKFRRFYNLYKDTHLQYTYSYKNEHKNSYWYSGAVNKHNGYGTSYDDIVPDTIPCDLCGIYYPTQDLSYVVGYELVCADCEYWINESEAKGILKRLDALDNPQDDL